MTDKCPNCGENLVSTDVFCPYCGADTRTTQASSSDAYSFAQPASSQPSVTCASCGSATVPGNVYCGNCGATISTPQGYVPPATSAGYTGVSTTPVDQSYNYGAATTTDDNRPWYKPPHRERSAKHPREWFFWTGWGLYIFFRVLFSLLFIILRVAARSRK